MFPLCDVWVWIVWQLCCCFLPSASTHPPGFCAHCENVLLNNNQLVSMRTLLGKVLRRVFSITETKPAALNVCLPHCHMQTSIQLFVLTQVKNALYFGSTPLQILFTACPAFSSPVVPENLRSRCPSRVYTCLRPFASF